ncbi:hypothetical protein AB4589_19340 [Vibrio sp. 10N.222.49.A3]|uniref:hypothetical protein n=1 Tax=Vibrio sp. 10N.222.49.A3 TaxID=3229611 RepID=UPI00354F5E56
MQSINQLCQLVNKIEGHVNKSENTTSFYVEGAFNDAYEIIYSIAELAISEATFLKEFITLFVDAERVCILDYPDFCAEGRYPAEYKLTVDTKDLVQSHFSGSGDINEYLFTSIDAFQKNLSELGLLTPLSQGALTESRNTRIHVCGLENAFGGPQLAVVPVIVNRTDEPDWLAGSLLPSQEKLLKQVHIVSKENIQLDPKSVQLSWGDYSQDIALPFRLAYAQHLLVSLSNVFYSVDKVHFKGVKHIEASICNVGNNNITTDWLNALQQSVMWCFSMEDPDVPIQLFIDRLTLEYNGHSLLNISSGSLISCLEQAKNNYKYVVAKRSDDYRKELKDIYSDIKTVTDKFAEKAASLSGELLKSLMAIAFVFTVGTMSKAIVLGELLHSKESHILFKIIALYLIFSFIIRWLNASSELKVAEQALNSWSKKLHNHISTQDVQDLINSHTRWSKYFYYASLAIVTGVQGTIAIAAFYIEGVLWYFSL